MTWPRAVPGRRPHASEGPRREPPDMVKVERVVIWGNLDPFTLTANELRAAVHLCRTRGLSISTTAMLLGCSSRHVSRIRTEARKAAA